MRRTDYGFTLVELIVAIAAAAIVLATALSFMLLGMRMEAHSGNVASQQQTARIVLTMAEKMAVSGNIKKVKYIGDAEEGSSWVLYGQDGQYLLQYLAADGTLRLGNSILMHDLQSAGATLSEDKKLFTLTFETPESEYSTTVYCRNGEIAANEVEHEELLDTAHTILDYEQTKDGRLAFLNVLCQQYGSDGKILSAANADPSSYTYFSEWYIDVYRNGWNKDTPWCACFISWAAAQSYVKDYLEAETLPRFADVDDGVTYFSTLHSEGHWLTEAFDGEGNVKVSPGDMVFFDWDSRTEAGNDPDHAGVVLNIRDEDGTKMIYTIEGNSNGKVMVNSYPADSEYILGFGILAWKAEPEHSS